MGETIGKYFRKTDMGEVYGAFLVSENLYNYRKHVFKKL